MFKQSKALKEINKIQEAIFKEEGKLTSKERVARIRIEADIVRKKYNLKFSESA